MARQGFTLIELSVVLGLMGLLLLFSLPKLGVFRTQLYQEASAAQLVSDLRKTQIEAFSSGETRYLIFNGKQFAFSRTGNPLPGGSGTVVVGSRKVIVSAAGRVRVE